MKIYKLFAGGLRKKKFTDLHTDIRRGIKAVSSVAGVNSTQVGSSAYKKMWFGDVDLFSNLDPEKIPLFAKQLQKIVNKLPDAFYFADCKIGGTKKKGRHWSKTQVIAGVNKGLRIEDALRMKAITKLDVIVPVKTKFGQRLVELTNFFYIPGVSAPFGDFLKEMDADIKKYHQKNRKLKVLKRKLSKLLWTDKKEDQKEIHQIARIVRGRAGKLATILADCEVARLLVKNKALQKKQLAYLTNLMNRKITMRNLGELEKHTNTEVNAAVNKSLGGR